MSKHGTKLLRSGKLSGRRLVYVSWLEANASKVAWITSFFERMQTETWPLESSFEAPLKTGDAKAGDIVNEWFGALVGDARSPAKGSRITDIVGVFTNAYVVANIGRSDQPASGELARMFELKKKDKEDRVRVWLAPVDRPTWNNYRICDIVLADPERAHCTWLNRLKEKDRFKWPEEGLGACSDEIAEAVATIIDKPGTNL